VGIGVVALRRAAASGGSAFDATEVLLVRRAKAPEVGKWTFPGGSLEVGEMGALWPLQALFEACLSQERVGT